MYVHDKFQGYKGRCQKHLEAGGTHKKGGGQMIFPKNGGSVDAIHHFWGECTSNVIILGGVWSHFMKFWGEVKKFIKKIQEWGEVDTYPK